MLPMERVGRRLPLNILSFNEDYTEDRTRCDEESRRTLCQDLRRSRGRQWYRGKEDQESTDRREEGRKKSQLTRFSEPEAMCSAGHRRNGDAEGIAY